MKNNNINTYFIFSHIILACGFIIENSDISETITYHVKFEKAPYYLFACFLFYFLGRFYYFISNSKTNSSSQIIRPKLINIDNKFYLYCYLACIIGLIVSILYVSKAVSLEDYIKRIFVNDSLSYREGGNKKVIMGRRNGGLSGAIKVFNILPLAVYLITFSIKKILPKFNYRITESQNKRLKKLLVFALICSLLRTLLLLDRLAFMSIIIAHLFLIVENKKFFNLKTVISVFSIFIVLNFISAQRGYSNFLLTINNYSNAHLVNLELLMQSFHDYTYGTKSLLNFWVNQIGGFLNFHLESPTYLFGENPAQNFIAFVYMDFGNFGVIVYFFLAMLVAFLDQKFRKDKGHFYKIIYFILLYDFVSCFTVPAHTAAEFWYALFFTILISKFYLKTKIITDNDCSKL